MGRSRSSQSCGTVLGLTMAALLTVSVSVPSRADDARGSDGWRRTAQGWERIGQLRAEVHNPRTRSDYFLRDEPVSARAARWDFHPLLLVALQGFAIAAAWACWGSRRNWGALREGG